MKTITSFQLEYSIIEGDRLPCAAIIVAAGNATRMGGEKQFLPLLGIPVLARTLMAFEQSASIRDVIVVAREKDIADVQALAETYQISKLRQVVCGGNQRQDSVTNGLGAVSSDVVYVAIHDGARPLITPDLIDQTVAQAGTIGAAALGVKVKDTIKRVDHNQVIEATVPRDQLMAMQTPQVFDLAIYRDALQKAEQMGLAVTDDCMICEAAGYQVEVVEGSYRNIKITTTEDIAVAEAFLRQEEQNG